MSIVLDGTSGITTNSGTVVSTTDATLNGLTVGKGGGSEAGSTTVGGSSLGGGSTNTGTDNSAFGFGTLYVNTSGSSNSGFGRGAMRYNTTGGSNSAFGYQALNNNLAANYNTAVGYQAGYGISPSDGYTVAIGYQAGYSTSTSNYNTFLGSSAGYSNTGNANVYVGYNTGKLATSGTNNCFVGYASGQAVTTGAKNSILGNYSGNQGGLDIRTASNYIVLSDGDGNPRGFNNNAGVWKFSNCNTQNNYTDTVNEFYSNANQRTLLFFNSSTGYTAQNVLSYVATASGTGYKFYSAQNSTTEVFYVLGNGNVQNTNNSYGAISDIKLKENIIDASPKLDNLMQVKVRNYNLKSDPTHKQLGVIAQELETVFPAMVEETPDRDEDNNDLGTTTKSVKYSVFVPMLIKSIQELKTIVDAQAAEIAELKAKVA
jgi:hypothetical protein